jgi:hypothetical protein
MKVKKCKKWRQKMTERYDYREEIKNDIRQYLEDNKNYISSYDYDDLYDKLWVADSVTGNASGSYTFSEYQAEQNLIGNKELLIEALNEFGGDFAKALESSEYADVTIRCYLLGECLSEVLEEMEEEDEEEKS